MEEKIEVRRAGEYDSNIFRCMACAGISKEPLCIVDLPETDLAIWLCTSCLAKLSSAIQWFLL